MSPYKTISNAFEYLLYTLRYNSNSERVLVLSGIPPRLMSIQLTVCYRKYFHHHIPFATIMGMLKNIRFILMEYIYHKWHIFYSWKISMHFVKYLNIPIQITALWELAQSCRHGKSLKCFNCGKHGHKEKFSNLYTK